LFDIFGNVEKQENADYTQRLENKEVTSPEDETERLLGEAGKNRGEEREGWCQGTKEVEEKKTPPSSSAPFPPSFLLSLSLSPTSPNFPV
jgi:hypothetical protein